MLYEESQHTSYMMTSTEAASRSVIRALIENPYVSRGQRPAQSFGTSYTRLPRIPNTFACPGKRHVDSAQLAVMLRSTVVVPKLQDACHSNTSRCAKTTRNQSMLYMFDLYTAHPARFMVHGSFIILSCLLERFYHLFLFLVVLSPSARCLYKLEQPRSQAASCQSRVETSLAAVIQYIRVHIAFLVLL